MKGRFVIGRHTLAAEGRFAEAGQSEKKSRVLRGQPGIPGGRPGAASAKGSIAFGW